MDRIDDQVATAAKNHACTPRPILTGTYRRLGNWPPSSKKGRHRRMKSRRGTRTENMRLEGGQHIGQENKVEGKQDVRPGGTQEERQQGAHEGRQETRPEGRCRGTALKRPTQHPTAREESGGKQGDAKEGEKEGKRKQSVGRTGARKKQKEDFALRSFRTHARAFAQSSLYTEQLLHADASKQIFHTRFHTEQFFHTAVFMQRRLHPEAFTQRRLHTEKTLSNFYTQGLYT